MAKLSKNQALVIEHVSTKTWVPTGDVAAATGIYYPSVRAALSGLEKKGLVRSKGERPVLWQQVELEGAPAPAPRRARVEHERWGSRTPENDDRLFLTDAEVRRLIAETLVAVQAPLTLQVKLSWGPRMTRAMGYAYPRRNEVRLSRPLWKAATPAERRETIVHEVCHLTNAERGNKDSHGHGWRAEMAKAGYPNAARCHNVDRGHLPGHVRWTCETPACATKGGYLSPRIAAEHRRGRHRHCRKCKATITLHEES